jgi:hypothetical protein
MLFVIGLPYGYFQFAQPHLNMIEQLQRIGAALGLTHGLVGGDLALGRVDLHP